MSCLICLIWLTWYRYACIHAYMLRGKFSRDSDVGNSQLAQSTRHGQIFLQQSIPVFWPRASKFRGTGGGLNKSLVSGVKMADGLLDGEEQR